MCLFNPPPAPLRLRYRYGGQARSGASRILLTSSVFPVCLLKHSVRQGSSVFPVCLLKHSVRQGSSVIPVCLLKHSVRQGSSVFRLVPFRNPPLPLPGGDPYKYDFFPASCVLRLVSFFSLSPFLPFPHSPLQPLHPLQPLGFLPSSLRRASCVLCLSNSFPTFILSHRCRQCL